jgi:MAE_28990/MAE_18760-like HEPN
MTRPIADTVNEIDLVKRECLSLLSGLRQFHSSSNVNNAYPDLYRLLVIPMLYAAWERCFTLCNGVVWRRLREECTAARTLNSTERATWLMKAGFYNSFTQKLLNSSSIGAEESKPKRSHFPALAAFLKEMDHWSLAPLDVSVDTDDLVMTFSNVNPDVVMLNAEAVGIASFPAFTAIKFGQLHSLVNHRNNIGHGGTLSAPPNGEFVDLWSFTEALIDSYSEVFKAWVVVRFPPPAPPPSYTQHLLNEIREFIKRLKAY